MNHRPPTADWLVARRKFVEAGGQATQSFGLGRIVGQVYALLYLSPGSRCLDEIAAELGVSKASVSTTVRQLERWAAVKRIWVQGDRKDYYEAETDFRAVLRHGVLDTLRKKLETAGTQLAHVEKTFLEVHGKRNGSAAKDTAILAERLERAKKFHGKVHGLLSNPLLDHFL